MTTDEQAEDSTAQPAQITAIKATIIPALQELGIAKLMVHYDGYGDEGHLGDLEIEPEAVSLPGPLEDQLRELVEAFLYQQHGAWGNDEGATGTVVIDIAESQVINEHGWYASHVEYSTTAF